YDFAQQKFTGFLQSNYGTPMSIALLASNGRLAASISSDGVITTRKTVDGSIQDIRVLKHVVHGYGRQLFLISPNGKELVQYSWPLYTGDQPLSNVILWDLATLQQKKLLYQSNDGRAVSNFAFSSNSRYLVYTTSEQEIHTWDLEKLEETVISAKGLYDAASVVLYVAAISNDGQHVAVVDGKGYLYPWKLEQGNVRFIGKRLIGSQYDLAFSPDSKLLAASHDKVVLYDTNTWAKLKEIGPQNAKIYRVIFSPSGRYLLGSTGDARLLLWESATGKQLSSYIFDAGGSPQNKSARLAKFSDDEKSLFYLGDQRFYLWSCSL
ncbi:MAG: WD40 repeat domain-containing protein, partial [Myxococcales bacterium]|nr:WD40 repeat domain-containing protein [Myxococcales bacterium]